MKTRALLAAPAALVIAFMPVASVVAQDPGGQPPGAEEAAQVELANKQLETVYKRLMAALDPQGQKALQDSERSWIRWRDNEAMLIARVGGAVGGSALRVDFSNAQLKLIRERMELLREYLQEAAKN